MPGALNVCSFVFAVDVHHVLFIGHDAASHALYSGVPYVFVVLHGKIHQVSHFTLACVLPTYKASTLCDYHCKPVLSDVFKIESDPLKCSRSSVMLLGTVIMKYVHYTVIALNE